jgi:hypothetical protein
MAACPLLTATVVNISLPNGLPFSLHFEVRGEMDRNINPVVASLGQCRFVRVSKRNVLTLRHRGLSRDI